MDPDPIAARRRLFPATTAAPPLWLLGAKACLLGLLVVGAAFPQVGGFAGKGMLPIGMAPGLELPPACGRHGEVRDGFRQLQPLVVPQPAQT